jgi:uncharacterized protein YbaR (Trm112 family)/SAM-dependent methyltransferase
MWMHAAAQIVCPRCKAALAARAIAADGQVEELSLTDSAPDGGAAARWIESGLLCCAGCRCFYPIHQGVPILLRYKTALAEAASSAWPAALRQSLSDAGLGFPADDPPPGEKFVATSFSTEWEAYDYGDTLWTASTADRLQAFRGECGLQQGDLAGKRFCEIGCGLGILTNEAASALGAEAWGMDLSTPYFAPPRSSARTHACISVQASIFAAPFRPQQFDFVYSHGVLHHTWNTKEAVVTRRSSSAAAAAFICGCTVTRTYGFRCRAGWPSPWRKTRPVIARLPPRVATAVLAAGSDVPGRQPPREALRHARRHVFRAAGHPRGAHRFPRAVRASA